MTERAPPAEKQHIITLILEMRKYLETWSDLMKRPTEEKIKLQNRMAAILKEMQEFRRKYPDD